MKALGLTQSTLDDIIRRQRVLLREAMPVEEAHDRRMRQLHQAAVHEVKAAGKARRPDDGPEPANLVDQAKQLVDESRERRRRRPAGQA